MLYLCREVGDGLHEARPQLGCGTRGVWRGAALAAKGGFMDTGNYRRRVLHKLADDLDLPKLTFHVIRRSIATLAQRKGTVKDVQGLLRHSCAATTIDVYMQEMPEGMAETVDAINRELRKKEKHRKTQKPIKIAGNLLPNATKSANTENESLGN